MIQKGKIMQHHRNPRILIIAGSDSGAAAGIQGDLKTVSALGGYAFTAITAITAQNTSEVRKVQAVDAAMIIAQCEAVFDDSRVDAVKIGMLPTREAVDAVAMILHKYQPGFVVWDPVMVSTSGTALVEDDVAAFASERLLPLAHVVTPNLFELAKLSHSSNARAVDEGIAKAQAHALLNHGARAVLVKGGHFEGAEAVDWLVWADGEKKFSTPRIDSKNTHGSGCTFASAIATLRPQMPDLVEAVGAAKKYVQQAIIEAQDWHIGKGSGPLSHFHEGTGHYRFEG